ncbi:MAG: type 1 glutamine amidotransferase [Gorillibacterium sp.]|nr:type 1 glutamine amidotransferase [Gorillibacterium sp.]
MKLHYLQHIPLENPGSILAWAKDKGYSLTHTQFFNHEPLPAQQDFDWLVIMGGPMNIYEEYLHPWLTEEKAFIRQAIDAGKVVLGICLGSQLIADVIGGKVTTNPLPEIGWFPIRWTDEAQQSSLFSFFPKETMVFQWHYDTFSSLPPEAKVIAESDACRYQAYVYRDRVFGFQFHLENTPELLEGLLSECANEMKPAAYVQSPAEVMTHPEYIKQSNEWMSTFLSQLEAQTEDSKQKGVISNGAC